MIKIYDIEFLFQCDRKYRNEIIGDMLSNLLFENGIEENPEFDIEDYPSSIQEELENQITSYDDTLDDYNKNGVIIEDDEDIDENDMKSDLIDYLQSETNEYFLNFKFEKIN